MIGFLLATMVAQDKAESAEAHLKVKYEEVKSAVTRQKSGPKSRTDLANACSGRFEKIEAKIDLVVRFETKLAEKCSGNSNAEKCTAKIGSCSAELKKKKEKIAECRQDADRWIEILCEKAWLEMMIKEISGLVEGLSAVADLLDEVELREEACEIDGLREELEDLVFEMGVDWLLLHLEQVAEELEDLISWVAGLDKYNPPRKK